MTGKVWFAWLLLGGWAWGQIHTENAGVTSPELPTLIEFLTWSEAEHLEDVRLSTQVLYGLRPDLGLKLTLPVSLHRKASFRDASGRRQSEELAGPGDARLDLKYSLFQKDGVLSSTRWAAVAGVAGPTGNDDREDGGVRIPRRLQAGTGAWEFSGGTAFTVIRDRHRASADVIYRHRTRHEGLRLAPSVDLDLAYWYRITPAVFEKNEERVEVRGVIELLNTYRARSHGSSGRFGSDGFLMRLAPGIQVYPSKRVLFEASVDIPLLDTLDDDLGDRRPGALIAVKILF